MNVIQHGTGVETTFTRVVDRFEAVDLGAPFKVVLNGAVKVTYNKAGEAVSYKIPDLDGLLGVIVITRILHPRKLSGADIKFVRKSLSLKQKELADKIELTVEHLSRCENNAVVLSPGGEKLFRIFALKTALKLHKLKACEAKTKLEDLLDKLFDAIKPVSVFSADDQLELHFHRSRPSDGKVTDGGTDDGHWDEKLVA